MAELAYLDNAATSFPKPEAVHEAVDRVARRCAVNPGRGGSELAHEAGELVDGLRRRLHVFFGNPAADSARLVFAANATDALNTAIAGVCGPGDHVVSTRLEHNSVLRPLWELERRGVLTHTLVPGDGAGFIDPADVAAALTPSTRLVILNHASNVLGTIQDAAAVGRMCRERGVLFLLDASQSAGLIPVDMDAFGVDLLAFTGHKGLMGPMGTGGLAVGPDVAVDPTRWGGTGVRSAHRGHLEQYPWRLEAGTLNLPGLAGLAAGLTWIEQSGPAVLLAEERRLAANLISGIEALGGVRTWCAGADERHLAVVSVTVDGMESDEVGTRLDVDHDVIARTGLQCAPLVHEDLGTVDVRGTVRFGIGPFNTDEHILRTLAGLGECAEAARSRRG